MPDRADLKTSFLQHTGWDGAHRVLVAGDASNRKYERLTQAAQTRILMDAPPEKGEDVRPFVNITSYLRKAGLSAPEVHAQDDANGFLLIEDLGDDLFARVIEQDPTREMPLYEAAVDVLLDLHQAPPPDLPRYDADVMTEAASLAFDWYQRGVRGSVNTNARNAFGTAMRAALQPLDAAPAVLIQRDYHAENLIWLPDRSGARRVGLLDYQDAMLGHPAYDLVSVLQDARRDVSPSVQSAMMDRYIAGSGTNDSAFRDAYALLGLQRNLRILGVFARLSLSYGKPHYVDLIPRVWHHIETNLGHPAAAHIAPLIRAELPDPTPTILQSLKNQCQTIPLP
ncbi:aminoglycoside phosphotransferase family protein [uncultured Tateyamaria sp.]|uniref:aminoglycoside phosphotransferase family protein n=1 Tax=uncultured Tateyamaria sp. TaxID=455651 RepID=UPI002628BFD8|nr:phosphotransferase [uncultured Tateyamaria sp.]